MTKILGKRREILEAFADEDWHSLDELLEKFALVRQNLRVYLNDMAVDKLLAKSDLYFAITVRGVAALALPIAKNLNGARNIAAREAREASLMDRMKTKAEWWSMPSIYAMSPEACPQVTAKSLRLLLKQGKLEYRPNPVFRLSPEYRVVQDD